MGCTSSAQNMTVPQTNNESTDCDKESNTDEGTEDLDPIKVDTDDKLNEVKIGEIAVLPTCDSLEENIQLDSNIKTFQNISDEESTPETQMYSGVENENVENENTVELQQEHSKLSSLKEVADQIFLVNIFEDLQTTSTVDEDDSLQKETSNIASTEAVPIVVLNGSNEEEIIDLKEEESKEAVSPTQSEGNRSTRWEALADIAAELPPSLAVDPITGQIYTVAK